MFKEYSSCYSTSGGIGEIKTTEVTRSHLEVEEIATQL